MQHTGGILYFQTHQNITYIYICMYIDCCLGYVSHYMSLFSHYCWLINYIYIYTLYIYPISHCIPSPYYPTHFLVFQKPQLHPLRHAVAPDPYPAVVQRHVANLVINVQLLGYAMGVSIHGGTPKWDGLYHGKSY